MSAPVLSPVERDEVLRFEIHEEDTLAGDVMCVHGDDVASTRIVFRCPCRPSATVCAAHHKSAIRAVEFLLARGATIACDTCWHMFKGAREFRDVMDEVPL